MITEELSPGGTPPSVANVDTLFGYNAYQEQTSAQTTLNGSPIFSESLTRDPAGRIATSIETTLGQSHQWQYSYDTAGRLSQVSVDNGSTYLRTFTYDENGNVVLRTTQASFLPAPATEVGTVDAQDRLLSFGTKSYTYDLNGQTASISDSSSGLTLTLGYDSQGNLTHVQRSDGKTIDYVIDGFGRRVGKKLNGSLSEQYLYDASNRLAAQTDSSGGVTWLFIYPHLNNSPGQMSSTGPNGQFYRVIQDIRGSPMLVVDTVSSQVAEQLIFDESGKVIEDTNPGLQPIGFAGGLYDSDTGFLHFGARDYDPSTGRWLQRDPIGFGGGDTNLYGYTNSDPVNSVDPSGQGPITAAACTLAASAGAGAVLALIQAGAEVSISTHQAEINRLQGILKTECEGTADYEYTLGQIQSEQSAINKVTALAAAAAGVTGTATSQAVAYCLALAAFPSP